MGDEPPKRSRFHVKNVDESAADFSHKVCTAIADTLMGRVFSMPTLFPAWLSQPMYERHDSAARPRRLRLNA